ncbi:hypothetical protein JCM19232_3611 [Vibrio ishigakensis]|uniref:Uncharacterized protein n=1 Tax=Vibrio ishigakensis TaxID=1481914 RepID=A0A0B8PCQ0_9VIBR|nr:hypothetical protein JCM19232_3611 [Vibrio ishigakensis]
MAIQVGDKQAKLLSIGHYVMEFASVVNTPESSNTKGGDVRHNVTSTN